jgi:hypothetical protein
VNRTEEDVPGAVGDWFDSDWEFTEHMGDVDPPSVPADAAVARDPPDFEMSGVLDRE